MSALHGITKYQPAEQRKGNKVLSALPACCRTEREIYHPPVQEAAGPSQVCPPPCLQLPHQQIYTKTAHSLIFRAQVDSASWHTLVAHHAAGSDGMYTA